MRSALKLKPAIKKLWLKALRSGKYQQAHQQLYTRGQGYCCLGVLNRVCHLRQRGDAGYLSDSAAKKIGLLDKTQNRLINLNDTKKWDFIRIANYIERYL